MFEQEADTSLRDMTIDVSDLRLGSEEGFSGGPTVEVVPSGNLRPGGA